MTPILLTLEAEDAETNQNVFNHAPASAGQAVDWARAGTLDWHVNAPSAGYYHLDIGYALSGANRWLNLEVNGDTQRVDFVMTGDWATYVDKRVKVVLVAGRNTVSLVKSDSSGPNIDNLKVKMTPTPLDWKKCADDGQTCNRNSNGISRPSIKYGVPGKWAYRYGVPVPVDAGLACDISLSRFGDPAPNQVKACYISDMSRPSRSEAEITTLHAVFDDSSPEANLASTLYMGEELMGLDNNYHLKMQSDGNLVLYSSGGTAFWSTGIDPSRNSNDIYTFHVLSNGMEVRKNNLDVIWSAYPSNVSSDTNYILSVSAAGNVYLQDMELNKVRWKTGPYHPPQFRSDNIAENIVEDVWARAGWPHVSDWNEVDHATFRRLHSDHSFWTMHNFMEKMNHVTSEFNDVGVDAWDESKRIYDILSDVESEILAGNIHNALDSGSDFNSEAFRSAHFLAKIIHQFDEEAFDFKELMGAEVERVQEGSALSSEIIDAMTGFNSDQGRSLSEATTDARCRVLDLICKHLSKHENVDKRLDYAVEVSASALFDVFMGHAKAQGWGLEAGLEVGHLSQAQLRLFFTHPRINGEGKFSMEIRVRLLNFTGLYGKGELKTDLGYGDFTGGVEGGPVAIHDIILPYTWEKGEHFILDAKFQGVKYTSVTGIIGEGGAAFSNVNFGESRKLSESFKNPSNAASQLIGDGVNIADVSAADLIRQNHGNQAPVDIQTRTDDSHRNMSSYLKPNPAFDYEGGIGIGASFIYDLREMRDIRRSEGYNSFVGTLMIKIILTEMFGEAAAIALGTYSTINTQAALYDLLTPALNVEYMAGGFVGDAVYTGLHRALYGRTEGIWVGASTFHWHAGRLFPWTYPAVGFSDKVKELFGVSSNYEIFLDAKFRVQYNVETRTREWFSKGNQPLKAYGTFQLKTSTHRCLSVHDLPGVDGYSYATSRACRDGSKFRWMAKPIGDAAESVYQIRSEYNGGQCVTIDSATYDRANPSVPKGTTVSVQDCGTSSINDPRADRWTVRRLSGRMMFKSVLDPSKCLDSNESLEDRVFHMWDCDLANENQLLTPEYKTGVLAANFWENLMGSGGSHTIRTSNGMCVGNELSSLEPSNGTNFVLQDCDAGLISSSQTYYFVDIGSGYYKIMLSHTHPGVIDSDRRYLDVSAVSPHDGAVIHAWQATNGKNQEWEVIVQSNGSVKLKARHSGKCLQYNGNVLVQSACVQRHDENQHFVINGIGYAHSGGYDTNPDLGNIIL
jgi:hypothetical protein